MIRLALLICLSAASLLARQRAAGFCEKGGEVVVTNSVSSTTRVQRSYPSCTVTVYVSGTNTLATLYSDNVGTSKANPFTADSNGYWFAYADNGRYDVRLSGGGLAAPITLGDVLLDDTAEATVSNTSTDFNFTYTVGDGRLTGDLSAAGAKTVTLTPCPTGVAGAHTDHYYYISGGVGTAETVLGTGGTCTSGASSGTLTFTTVNTHTGSWTFASATAGIQEALYASSTNKYVRIPPGSYTVRQTISPPAASVIEGPGANMSSNAAPATITFTSLNSPLFKVWTDHVRISGLKLVQSGTAVAGNAAVTTLAENDGDPYNAQAPMITDLEIQGFYNGIVVDGSSNAVVERNQVLQCVNDGFQSLGGGGRWNNNLANSNSGDGLKVSAGTYRSGVPRFDILETFCNHGWGINATAGLIVHDSFLNNDWLGEVLHNVAGATGGDYGTIANTEIQYAGDNIALCAGSAGSTTAPGIRVSGEPLRIINSQIFSSRGNGIELTGAAGNNLVIGSRIYGNGIGAQANNVYGLRVTNTINTITSNRINDLSIFSGNQNVISGNTLSANSASPVLELTAGVNVTLVGNRIHQNGAGNAFTSAGGTSYAWFGNDISSGAVTHGGGLLNVGILRVTNFAGLGNGIKAGEMLWCSDCAPTTRPVASDANAVCANTGTGAIAVAVDTTGTWRCTP